MPDILFHVPFAADSIDEANKIIRGVSLITGDLEAEGHGLHTDGKLLSQIHQLGAKNKKVTVKMDHKGPDGRTFKAIAGYLTNFSIDASANKVRGDFELLHTEPLTPKILEMAKRMPGNFGLSVAFKGKGEKGAGGKQFARCEKLLSVDLVENPAANPDGLFAVPVDTVKNGMDSTTTSSAEPTIADVLAALNKQNETIEALGQRIQEQEALIASMGGETEALTQEEIDHLTGMSDADLQALGLTREQVDAAVADAMSNGGGEGEGAGEAAGVGADAAAGAAAGAALSAGQLALREVRQFKAQMAASARAEEAAEVEHAFAVIDEKVEALAGRNDELETALATKDAEIKALRTNLKTGARGVAAGVESEVSFSALAKKEGTFENLLQAEFSRLLKQPKMTELKAKSQAIDFMVRRHPAEYREWRASGSRTIELRAQ